MRWSRRVRRVIRRIGIDGWITDDNAIAVVALLLLLLDLLVQQSVLQSFILLFQIANRLFLTGLLGCLTLAGHLLRQGVDPGDFSVGIGVGRVGRRGRRNVKRLHTCCILWLFLAVMHLSAGIGPFIDLLGLRDAAQRHGCGQQGKQSFEVHARITDLFRPRSKGAPLDILLILKALILGLVEAASEFLPISSTGHLIIVGDFLNFTGPRAEAFQIFIQLGAILAVVWIYRARLLDIALNLDRDRKAQRLILNLAIAFIPAAILGLWFHKQITHYLFNPVTVAGALVVGGIAILLIERYARTGRVQAMDDMNWKDALVVGIAQSVALFPGVSRSGATIMGGMLSGLSRFAATEFSFFLAIPTMFAASFYSLYKEWHLLTVEDIPMFAVGFVAAFLGGLAVVRFLLAYVGQHSFAPFAWYRIVFGGLLLAYFHYHPWVGAAG